MATLQAVFTQRSSSHWRSWLAGAAAVVLLLIGVWFGGHPSWLPSPLRSAFVSKTADERLVQTTLDLISKDYYRRVNTRQTAEQRAGGRCRQPRRPVLALLPAGAVRSFQHETNPQVAGIGVEVAAEPVHGGIEVEEVFQGSPAAKAGLRQGDIITAVGSTSLAGKTVEAGSKLIRGKVGTVVRLTISRNGKHAFGHDHPRRRDCAGRLLEAAPLPGQGARLPAVHAVHRRVGRAAAAAGPEDAEGGRTGPDPRPARQPRRPARAGGRRRQPVHQERHDRDHARAQPADHRLHGARRRDRADDPDGRAGRSRHRVLGGDRHRRAQGPRPRQGGRHPHLRQGRLPGADAAARAAARSTSPSASTSRPTATTSGGVAGGVKEGRGITPNVYVYDNPAKPGTHALRVAEQTVAGEIR